MSPGEAGGAAATGTCCWRHLHRGFSVCVSKHAGTVYMQAILGSAQRWWHAASAPLTRQDSAGLASLWAAGRWRAAALNLLLGALLPHHVPLQPCCLACCCWACCCCCCCCSCCCCCCCCCCCTARGRVRARARPLSQPAGPGVADGARERKRVAIAAAGADDVLALPGLQGAGEAAERVAVAPAPDDAHGALESGPSVQLQAQLEHGGQLDQARREAIGQLDLQAGPRGLGADVQQPAHLSELRIHARGPLHGRDEGVDGRWPAVLAAMVLTRTAPAPQPANAPGAVSAHPT
jgi:hypothetical protein